MKQEGSLGRVVVTGGIHPAGILRLQERCDVRVWEGEEPIGRTQLLAWLRDADALVSSGSVRVDAQLLAAAPNVKVIAQSAVGHDNVDVSACKAAGVLFANTPGVLVDATADLTFALVLLVMRRLVEAVDHARQGMWGQGQAMGYGHDLAAKTIGIIGMGDIGCAVARRAQACNMEVIYHNRTRRQGDVALGATYLEFEQVLAQADCVVVLTPLTSETRGMFGVRQFALMKSSAFFVNASRGPVVDTQALLAALQRGSLAGAALDVTDPEPLPRDHPLLALPNVVVTPHIGSATHETRARMAELTADNILRGLSGEPLLTPVAGP